MRRGASYLARASPVPSARRRLPTQQLTARDEALFNALRQTAWRLINGQRGALPKGEDGVAANLTSIALPLNSLLSALPDDVHNDLRARRSTLLETLERCPKWFSFQTGAAAARGVVNLTANAIALKDTHADVTLEHLTLPKENDASEGPEKSSMVKLAWAGMPAIFIDVSKPILTAEEIESARLPRLIALTMIPFGADVPPDVIAQNRTITDESIQDALVVPPELAPFDSLYRKKGFLQPSHVLHVMLEYVPSFFVELGKVFAALPPKVRLDFYDHIGMDKHGKYRSLLRPFQEYPMLFEVEIGSFRKSLVRLNFSFPFVAQHPRFGVADRAMRQYSKEFARERGVVSRDTVRFQYSTTNNSAVGATGGVNASANDVRTTPRHLRLAKASDLQIFQILLAHLPRVPTLVDPEVGLYNFTPLVSWVNSFSESELDLLNEVPQERVLTIVTRYRRIFQLSTIDGADPNLYSPWSENPWRTAAAKSLQHNSSEETDTRSLEGSSSAARPSLPHQKTPSQKQQVGAEMDAATEARVTSFKSAMADELLGLDDLLGEGAVKETFDRGEDNSEELVAIDDADDITAPGHTNTNTYEGSGKYATPERQEGEEQIEWGEELSSLQDDVPMDDNEFANAESNDAAELPMSPNLVENGAEKSLVEVEVQPHEGETNQLIQERHNIHNIKEDVSDSSSSTLPSVLSSFDLLCIRRLPPTIAPGSLSDLDASTTPDEVLLAHILRFLTPPPPPVAVVGGGVEDYNLLHQWRWVQIEEIYRAIPAEQRFRMKPFRGLPNFIRLHGRLFEVSLDVSYVILHDPSRLPPLIPTQRTFTLEERMSLPATFDSKTHESGSAAVAAVLKEDAEQRAKYRSILRDSQVPTNRAQLRFLEPGNPLLNATHLIREIAAFLPQHPVPLMQLMSRLPPIMKAAIPSSGLMKFFTKHPHILSVSYDSASGKTVVSRVDGGQSKGGSSSPASEPIHLDNASTGVWSLSKTLQCLDEIIEGAGRRGISFSKLTRVLPRPALKAIARETSTDKLDEFLGLYPERFELIQTEDTVLVRKAS
ncbi:unnamed protein product [Bodo saltans]|uniref:Uncharacterized protein n=1 Tax=Bodo saltans TaxID=75058 RepID=A0A0S4JAQ4_BODSA|nr:unnamed protein product [Bodo saltans]|eukprot:CUG86225.1 unnamed protein product [Bodo saltans]